MMKENRRIGLALGGGSVLGAAHIGVLKVLEEKNISVNKIAGTSIGAFIAALYAFGKNSEDIKKIAMDLKWMDISNVSLSKCGLLSNSKLGELILKHLGKVNVEDAKIPLGIVACDITKGERFVIRNGDLAEAIRASTCIPGIFSPVEFENKVLVDGGIFENVPITTLKEMGANYIIAVDLISKRTETQPQNIIEILLKTFHIMISASRQIQKKDVNVLIQPNLSSFSKIDPKNTRLLIKKGYEEASTCF